MDEAPAFLENFKKEMNFATLSRGFVRSLLSSLFSLSLRSSCFLSFFFLYLFSRAHIVAHWMRDRFILIFNGAGSGTLKDHRLMFLVG
jgi:hypothetical protein